MIIVRKDLMKPELDENSNQGRETRIEGIKIEHS